MLAVFTHVDQIAEFSKLKRCSLTIDGRSLLVLIPPSRHDGRFNPHA
jgi:hypothetical protein